MSNASLLSLLVAIALGAFSIPDSQAQTFPAAKEWTQVTKSGLPVVDAALDSGPAPARDVVGPAEPSARVSGDGSFVYFSVRVDGDPRPGGAWSSGYWTVEIDTDGESSKYELLARVNGSGSQVELWSNSSSDGTGNPVDVSESLLQTYPIATHAASESDGSNDFFVLWAVPASDLVAAGASPSTPLRLLYGCTGIVSPTLTVGNSGDIAGLGNTCGSCTLTSLLSDAWSLPVVAVDPSAANLDQAVLHVVPNPVRAGCRFEINLPAPGSWHLAVFDAAGRIVRRLEPARSTGTRSIAWDGTNDAGCQVASGTYFAVLKGDSATLRRTFVVAH